MKYYILDYNSSNIKETGTQFQSIDGIVGDIQQDFLPFEGKIDFAFKLPEPFLQKKAKPTTYIHVAMIPNWFLVVKKYFINFLCEFKIGEFQTWNLKVHQNNSIINDYQLFILSETFQRELIEFENCEFYVGNFSDYNFTGESINIKTYEEFIKKREELSKQKNILKYKKIVVNLSSMTKDMFRIINVPASGYYVSEKLKNAIEKEKFTGISFREIEEMDNRIKVIYK